MLQTSQVSSPATILQSFTIQQQLSQPSDLTTTKTQLDTPAAAPAAAAALKTELVSRATANICRATNCVRLLPRHRPCVLRNRLVIT